MAENAIVAALRAQLEETLAAQKAIKVVEPFIIKEVLRDFNAWLGSEGAKPTRRLIDMYMALDATAKSEERVAEQLEEQQEMADIEAAKGPTKPQEE